MVKKQLIICVLATLITGSSFADNPLVTHMFTADPTARVFDGVLYVYPSHDIPATSEAKGINEFTMGDYHVFSSTDLVSFKDHGVALDQNDVPWAKKNYSMWAPDCIKKGDTYYFYFPTQEESGGFRIGVATSDSPTGPFIPEPEPIKYANNIDPGIFIDDDGTPYLYFGGGPGDSLRVMRLKDDMKTPDMEPKTLKNLGDGYKEGSFMFKRKGIYYFTYPFDPDGDAEEIYYAVGKSPLGPFKRQGMILKGWTDGCWTDHHSIVEYKGQWYLFYHSMVMSGNKKLRSMCADKLFFDRNGNIKEVIPTRRGIGICKASDCIQVDRYHEGSSSLETPLFEGDEPSGFYIEDLGGKKWVNYPDVDFGDGGYTSVSARIASRKEGGKIEVRIKSRKGTLLGTIAVPDTDGKENWEIASGPLKLAGKNVKGVQDLYLIMSGTGSDMYHLDWIRFDKQSEE